MLYAFCLLFPLLVASKVGAEVRPSDDDEDVIIGWTDTLLLSASHLTAPVRECDSEPA